MFRRTLAVLVATLVAATTLAACSSGGSMKVTDAWARTSMGMDRAGAAYMVITNDTDKDDALIGASSSAAATVEIHETTTAADGTMAMSPVDEVPVAAGGSAKLEPGGYHIMLIDLADELVVGESIDIALTFREAGEVKVTAEVREG